MKRTEDKLDESEDSNRIDSDEEIKVYTVCYVVS